MTQEELDAGGQAVIDVATAAGYGNFISLDQARGLAAAVIRKVDAHRATRPLAAAPPVEHHAIGFFAGLIEKLKG